MRAVSLLTIELIPHSLTPVTWLTGIRSLVGFGNLVGPLAHPVLYLRQLLHEAIPKYISGRTSYLQVWLAFHPYPQVITWVFNLSVFGPPRDFTLVSPCPWIDHLVSGLLLATQRPIQTRFRFGYTSSGLTLLQKVTRWLIMQKARGRTLPEGHSASTACRHKVSGTISLPSQGYFSPFPHGTGSLSVSR